MVLRSYLYGLDLGRGKLVFEDSKAVAVRHLELVEPTRDEECVARLSLNLAEYKSAGKQSPYGE
jgi:hypothetical protein